MFELFVVATCLFLNAVFAAYEMAFVSVPRTDLKLAVKKGNSDAKRLLAYRDSPERTLSIIQVGITLVGAIAAAVGGAGAGDTLEPFLVATFGISESLAESVSVVAVVIPLTYLSVVIGELVPKTLALRNPLKIALAGAKFLFLADRIFSPIISVLEKSTHQILKFGFPKSKGEISLEAITLELNEYSPIHQRFILNMANIEKKQIKDLMIPFAQVNSVNVLWSVHEVFLAVMASGHTRLPVKLNDTVTGVLHTKEFISLRESGETEWQKIIRPCLWVHPQDLALTTLRIMQERKTHMAIVSSGGQTAEGICTLEDIIEEIVGDIYDEDDDGRIRKVYSAKARSRAAVVDDSR